MQHAVNGHYHLDRSTSLFRNLEIKSGLDTNTRSYRVRHRFPRLVAEGGMLCGQKRKYDAALQALDCRKRKVVRRLMAGNSTTRLTAEPSRYLHESGTTTLSRSPAMTKCPRILLGRHRKVLSKHVALLSNGDALEEASKGTPQNK